MPRAAFTSPLAAIPGLDDMIPADTTTQASLSPDSIILGALNFSGDHDWYSINLVQDVWYQIDLTGYAPNPMAPRPGVSDPYLRVFDASGTTQVAADDDGGIGLNAQLVFQADYSGTYFLEAASYADLYRGVYQMSVDTLPELPHGPTKRGTLTRPGDTDTYVIDLSAGDEIMIDLKGLRHANGLQDTILTVTDESGQVIAYSDDTGLTRNSRVFLTAETDVTYFVEVSGKDGMTGSYRIEMVDTDLAPQSEAPLSEIGDAFLF